MAEFIWLILCGFGGENAWMWCISGAGESNPLKKWHTPVVYF
jgi:hypothetical protein